MSRQVLYGEDRSGFRWPAVAVPVVGWVVTVGAILASVFVQGGLAVLAVVGLLIAISTLYMVNSRITGIRVYEDGLAIGGIRGRERRLQQGKWPPRKLRVGSQSSAVFTVPWVASSALYVITERSEIKRIRRDLRRYKRKTNGTSVPLGLLANSAAFANALLVISVDPNHVEVDPAVFGKTYGQYGRLRPVQSPIWLVPTRNPGALRETLQRLRDAPPVYDRLPQGVIEFEVLV